MTTRVDRAVAAIVDGLVRWRGRHKWERLGLTYTLNDTEPPSNERAKATCEVFRAEGLQAF